MRRGLVLATVVVAMQGGLAAAQEAEHPAAGLPPPPPGLSGDDLARAVEIATPEERITSTLGLMRSIEGEHGEGAVVLSDVRSAEPSEDGAPLALVTLYRYADDTTLRRLVDLERGEVVDEIEAEGVSPPLSRTEAELARALLLEDDGVLEILGGDVEAVEFEFLLTRTIDPEDPLFGRRVVYPLFNTERGYLPGSGEVVVDLTSGEVVPAER